MGGFEPPTRRLTIACSTTLSYTPIVLQMAGAEPGMTISGLSDTGAPPGRRFQPLILGLAVAIWALTHFTGHDSRDPSGLTLANQPWHSSASGNHREPQAYLTCRRTRPALTGPRKSRCGGSPIQPQQSSQGIGPTGGRVSRQTHCSGATSGAQFLNLDFDPARRH